MPSNTRKVDRSSLFGNPYRVGLVNCTCLSFEDCSHNLFNRRTVAEAVQAYRDMPRSDWQVAQIRRELKGKNLGCWCPLDGPCHADVLLELANGVGDFT